MEHQTMSCIVLVLGVGMVYWGWTGNSLSMRAFFGLLGVGVVLALVGLVSLAKFGGVNAKTTLVTVNLVFSGWVLYLWLDSLNMPKRETHMTLGGWLDGTGVSLLLRLFWSIVAVLFWIVISFMK